MLQDWDKTIANAQAEIELLEIRQEEISRRIEQLKNVIVAAKAVIETSTPGGVPLGLESSGITDACRTVLKSSKEWMTPTQVRDRLEMMGFPIKKQPNAMASIHAVLKRLAKDKGEAATDTAQDGGTIYRWKEPRTTLGSLRGK